MNKYWLSVVTGYNSPNFCGMSPFTVEADGVEYGTSGVYRFWSKIDGKIENVAMYPIDRTIIKKIEKIKEQ
jgi:hypothetical protein